MSGHQTYRSLNRPLEILGVERKLFFCLLLGCFLIFYIFEAFRGALGLFVLLMLVARTVNAVEPRLFTIIVKMNGRPTRFDPAKWVQEDHLLG